MASSQTLFSDASDTLTRPRAWLEDLPLSCPRHVLLSGSGLPAIKVDTVKREGSYGNV